MKLKLKVFAEKIIVKNCAYIHIDFSMLNELLKIMQGYDYKILPFIYEGEISFKHL
jgi:hypothetical protein